jgi:hypothetical protein
MKFSMSVGGYDAVVQMAASGGACAGITMAGTTGAITEGDTAEAITAALLAGRAGASKMVSASRIVAIEFSLEAASVGGLFHISKEAQCPTCC